MQVLGTSDATISAFKSNMGSLNASQSNPRELLTKLWLTSSLGFHNSCGMQ